jgi:hypothetical protein
MRAVNCGTTVSGRNLESLLGVTRPAATARRQADAIEPPGSTPDSVPEIEPSNITVQFDDIATTVPITLVSLCVSFKVIRPDGEELCGILMSQSQPTYL